MSERAYLIYLRKSQKDRELEDAQGVSDTLQRHRDRLLQLARSRNYVIAEIFEEVVSGDTIAERPEMQRLLLAVETGRYAGVLVMEIARLARGNTKDQGVVAETFLYSGTKIITPDRIYDTAEDTDEEYLEFELFMARREYKAISRRQMRGKMASLHEGKYIGGTAPYGYEKVKLEKQKGQTLRPVPEKAAVVAEIFSLYTRGERQADGEVRRFGAYTIAKQLNSRAIPSPAGRLWTASAVKEILTNPTYAGYLRWGYRAPKKQVQDGVLRETRPLNHEAQLLEGKHEAIIPQDTWQEACRIRAGRSHTPMPTRKQLSNPLAGVLSCAQCGRSMLGLPQKKGRGGAALMIKCPTVGCPTVSSNLQEVEQALMETLRGWLAQYEAEQESLQAPQSDEDTAAHAREVRRLQAEREKLQTQQDALYDLLEQGAYDKDTFLARSRVLSARRTALDASLSACHRRIQQANTAQQARLHLIPNMARILTEYQSLPSPAAKNQLLKLSLTQVIYRKQSGGRWRESDLQLYLFPRLPQSGHD